MLPTSSVALHIGQGLTLDEYLFRVIVLLFALIGTGVAVYWCVRAIETIRSENRRRVRINDNEP